MTELIVIGGGLAGCEAAWQAAQAGVTVRLYEMRPQTGTGAHRTDRLAELVCSNSLGSRRADRPAGILQEELRLLGSLLMRCADGAALPAGTALAVDRERFSASVTAALQSHPRIRVIRSEVTELLEGPVILAAGPLISSRLSEALRSWAGEDHLYFYDAIAPVVWGATIDFSKAFLASRHGIGESAEGDYVNCPMTRDEYERFIDELRRAERAPLRAFEAEIERGVPVAGRHFEGCLPIEVMARRHPLAPAHGPMRPVGLVDPRTGHRPYAVVQLRREDPAGELYNMVGFQTNLTESEQRRVFRMIPGLERVEFARYGQMHRNTYLNAPRLLKPTLQWRTRDDLWVAGQLAGTEGYVGAIATGWLAGVNAARRLRGLECVVPPPDTMLGALCRALTEGDAEGFQPVKAHLGLLPLPADLPEGSSRRDHAQELGQRALEAMERWRAATFGSSGLP